MFREFLVEFEYMKNIWGMDTFNEMKKNFDHFFPKIKQVDYIFYDLISAFKNERDKKYLTAADHYITAYTDIRYRLNLTNSELNYAKKFFDYRISMARYNHILDDYHMQSDCSTAISLYKEYLDDEYTSRDIQKRMKESLAYCLYFQGKKDFKEKYYSSAKESLEEAFSLYNSNNKFGNYGTFSSLKYDLAKTYYELALKEWSIYFTTDMETAIDYLRKSAELDYNDAKKLINNLKLYYYLYKAKNECESDRTFNLQQAKTFAESGINVSYLEEKSYHISELKNNIEQKQRNISNLDYELNSINNNINNTQSIINAKRSAISNFNTNINSLNDLAASLISDTQKINTESEKAISTGNNQVKVVESNIEEKKNFVEEIKKLEKEKKEEIENMEANNKNLKQKNAQLILILSNLESKLN